MRPFSLALSLFLSLLFPTRVANEWAGVALARIKFKNPSAELHPLSEFLFHANARQLTTLGCFQTITLPFLNMSVESSFVRVYRETKSRSLDAASILNFGIRMRQIVSRLMTLCALYVNNGYLSRRASGRQFATPMQESSAPSLSLSLFLRIKSKDLKMRFRRDSLPEFYVSFM